MHLQILFFILETSDDIVSIEHNQIINQTENGVIWRRGTFTELNEKISGAAECATITLDKNYIQGDTVNITSCNFLNCYYKENISVEKISAVVMMMLSL